MVKKKSARWTKMRKSLMYSVLFLMTISLLPVLVFIPVDPPSSMVIWQRSLTESGPQTHLWVARDEISAHMAVAVIASEDQHFPDHHGFDTGAMWTVLKQSMEGKPLRGASTLTQQVAKNLFLWQGRSFFRKALEAWYTVWLEVFWSKQRILEIYLNIAETGPGTFGVEAAAQRYFNIPAKQLTARQAALIAAVLPNPVRFRVDQPSAHVLKRQAWILGQMRNLGGVRVLDQLNAE